MKSSSTEPPVPEVLAEIPRLLRLARAVAHVDDVDDLVQETTVRALQLRQPPDRLRGWLGTVLKNMAASMHKRRQRRARFEASAAQQGSECTAPSAAETVAQLAMARRVTAAVERLPEPYRTAVLMRFYRELSTRDIAAALKASEASVRQRLSRAVAMLRSDLCSTREDRLGLVALGALASPSSLPQASSSVAWMGVHLMKRATIAVLAVSIAMVCLLAWFESQSVPRPRDASEAATAPALADTAVVASAPVAEQLAQRVPVPNNRRAATVGAPIAKRFLAGIRGRVLHANGQVAAGCDVQLFHVDIANALQGCGAPGAASFGLGRMKTTTDSQGQFTLSGIDVSSELVLNLAAGLDDATARRLGHVGSPGVITDLGDVVLESKGCVVGRCVDDHGQPLANVRVRILPRGNDRGLPDYLHGMRLDLVEPRGYLVVERATAASELHALPAWVEDAYGALGIREAFSDVDGKFRLAGIVGRGNHMTASKLGFWPAHKTPLTVAAGEVYDLGDVCLTSGHTIRGRVVDAVGKPVRGAELLLGPRSFRGRELHVMQSIGTTSADGSFVIGGQAKRDSFVAVRAPGRGWQVSGPHDSGESIDVSLARAVSLAITCDEHALPSNGVRVRLLPGSLTGELLLMGETPPSAVGRLLPGDPECTLPNLEPGHYTLLVDGRGCAFHHEVLELLEHGPSSVHVHVELSPSKDISVVVVDCDGAPLAGATVVVHPEESPAWTASLLSPTSGFEHWRRLPAVSARTGAGGVATLVGLASGMVRITASHPGCGTVRRSVQLPAASVAFVLPSAGGLDCQLRDGGLPLQEPRQIGLTALLEEHDAPVQPQFLTTDASGRIAVDGLAPGRYRIKVEPESKTGSPYGLLHAVAFHSSNGPGVAREVVVRPGVRTSVQMELQTSLAAPDQPVITVHGRITLDGQPAEGLFVRIFCMDAFAGPGRQPPVDVALAADGTYRADNIRSPVRTGRLSLSVRRRDPVIMMHAETVGDVVALAELDWSRDIPTGDLVGTVVDNEGKPAACKLSLNGKAKAGDGTAAIKAQFRTDELGRFAMMKLPLGTYHMQTYGGGNSMHDGVVLQRGVNTVPLIMMPYCRVAGTVDLRLLVVGEGQAITVLLEPTRGTLNYRPMGRVDRATGKFVIASAIAQEYVVHVRCGATWYQMGEQLTVRPGKCHDLVLVPRPGVGPATPGPLPPEQDRPRPGAVGGPPPKKPSGQSSKVSGK